MFTEFNYWLTEFLKIYQSTLVNQYKPAPGTTRFLMQCFWSQRYTGPLDGHSKPTINSLSVTYRVRRRKFRLKGSRRKYEE